MISFFLFTLHAHGTGKQHCVLLLSILRSAFKYNNSRRSLLSIIHCFCFIGVRCMGQMFKSDVFFRLHAL